MVNISTENPDTCCTLTKSTNVNKMLTETCGFSIIGIKYNIYYGRMCSLEDNHQKNGL